MAIQVGGGNAKRSAALMAFDDGADKRIGAAEADRRVAVGRYRELLHDIAPG